MGVCETEAYSQFMALCVGKMIIFWGMIPLIFGTTTKSYQNPRVECSGGYWVHLYDHGRPHRTGSLDLHPFMRLVFATITISPYRSFIQNN